MKIRIYSAVLGTMLGILALTTAIYRISAQTTGANNLTPDQKEKIHSELFTNLNLQNGTIPQKLSETTGDLVIKGFDLPVIQGTPRRTRSYPPWSIEARNCLSNVIISGTALSSTSHMTDNKAFLYTDWSFEIDEVLKNNPSAPVGRGQVVTVTRPGGQLEIDGRTVYAIVTTFKNFNQGERYLLFLKYVPNLNLYQAFGNRSFLLSNGMAVHATGVRLERDIEGISDTQLLEETRDSVSIGCGESVK